MNVWHAYIHWKVQLNKNSMRLNYSFLLAIIILTKFSGCIQNKDQKSENFIHVKYLIIKKNIVNNSIRTSGKLTSSLEYRLSFKTGGIINKIIVKEGENVRKGQLLAQLELSEIQSKVKQAQLSVNKSERDYQRAKNLYQDSVVTLELFQNATTALEVARSDLRIAEFNLKHSNIFAPANGLILKKMAEENEIIAPGHPVLYLASTESEWIMRTSVTDKDRIHLSLLDSANIFFDAYPEQKVKAIVSEIAAMADPYTGTYEIELSLIDSVQNPVNGLIGTAYIYPTDTLSLPIIPYEALMEGERKTGQVYVLKNGHPEKRNIKIYAIEEEGIMIKDGISAGDSLIIEGGPYIRTDSRIIVEPLDDIYSK